MSQYQLKCPKCSSTRLRLEPKLLDKGIALAHAVYCKDCQWSSYIMASEPGQL